MLRLLYENEKLEKRKQTKKKGALTLCDWDVLCEIQTGDFGLDYGDGHAPDSFNWDMGTGRRRHPVDWGVPHVLCTFYYIYIN